MNDTEETRLLKPQDIKRIFDVSIPKIREMTRDGILPSVKVGTRDRYYLPAVKKALEKTQ